MQNYFQQVNSLSPEDRLDKFCKEAGFMSVVEVGQYFVTRNISEFVHAVACHEYTLPRDDPDSEPKGWIKGKHRELDLYWKSQRAFSNSSTELKFEFPLWKKTILSPGSEFPSVQYDMWTITLNTTPKISQVHKKRKMYQTSLEVVAARSKGKSETSTKGIYWHDDHSIKWKSLDWHWTIKARSRVSQFVEESHQSSSTQSKVTSRTRWSNSILQD